MSNEELISKVSAELKIELDGVQYITALSIINLLEQKEFTEICLTGSAGTGKSVLINVISKVLEQKTQWFYLVAPTNKAAKILSNYTGREVVTLHTLLNLKPQVDILLFDLKNAKFESDLDITFPHDCTLIIDECSMINDELYDLLIDRANKSKCNILFVGDQKQIAPVNNKHCSKTFNCENKFVLQTIHRQKADNPLLALLNKTRKEIQYTFKPFTSKNGSLFVYDKWKELIDHNIDEFKQAIEVHDATKIKLLAYTNKRVEAFNQVIRKRIWGNNVSEYMVGDFITGYDSIKDRNKDIITNSEDYQIMSVSESSNLLFGAKGWKLKLMNLDQSQSNSYVCVLSRDNSQEVFYRYAQYIESLRLDALKHNDNKRTRGKLWKKYFDFSRSFLTPIDLVYDCRIVKRKSLDYGYAISSHKSQGSSYNTVLIDMGNIFKCFNRQELRQLQYVALSRTRKDIHILI